MSAHHRNLNSRSSILCYLAISRVFWITGDTMLQLRPSCEHCNTSLPADSTEAMICSYECTFCRTCVETVLENVCPNCGGGFTQRPNRPAHDLKNGNCLENNPASEQVVHKPVNKAEHQRFAQNIKSTPPEQR